jgi:hypothetical protein
MQIPTRLNRYANKGLVQDAIVRIEEVLGIALPKDYRDFLVASNGMSIDGGVLVYGSDDLVDRNETFEVKDYMPGYVAIGDSGEGAVFVMKLDSADSSVYAVDAGVMDAELMNTVGASLQDWMNKGCPFR